MEVACKKYDFMWNEEDSKIEKRRYYCVEGKTKEKKEEYGIWRNNYVWEKWEYKKEKIIV